MNVDRMLNMHRTDEIINLSMNQYKDLEPAPSVKFNTQILDLDPDQLRENIDIETTVEIENTDTITASLDAIKEGYKPLILNMANDYTPGGGFLTGAIAQEEHLFRCTNYFRTLTEGMYPIKRDEIIYSPKVHILKDANYDNLDEPQSAAFVAVPAIQRPHLKFGQKLLPWDYSATFKKVNMIYQLGVIGNHDCLILGALGCGAFRNPPQEIAKIFCSVTSQFVQKFKKIVFAVKCSDDNENCDVFKRTFLRTFTDEDQGSSSESEQLTGDPYNPVSNSRADADADAGAGAGTGASGWEDACEDGCSNREWEEWFDQDDPDIAELDPDDMEMLATMFGEDHIQ